MTRMCGECGYEIPEGMDFCPHCGAQGRSYTVSDSGAVITACPNCGAPYSPGDMFCGKCGASLPKPAAMMPRMRKYGNVAILLALIPGFFNVFGLGHILMRSYARGAMFLVMSLVVWYLSGWSLYGGGMLVMLLSLALYLYQCFDVMRVAFTPEGK